MAKKIKLKFISTVLLIAMLFLFSGCESEDLSKRVIANMNDNYSITTVFDKHKNIVQKTECNYALGTILITNYIYQYKEGYGVFECSDIETLFIDENNNIINVSKQGENNNE